MLCITHLPQIAARGVDAVPHREARSGRSHGDRVDRLDDDARVEEIARMIGGAAVTEPVRASARELLTPGTTVGEGESERRKAKAKVDGRNGQEDISSKRSAAR